MEALRRAVAPEAMIKKAEANGYNDFLSDSETPISDLVRDCRAAGLTGIMNQAMNGDFDATSEESQAWAKREGLAE